MIEIAVNNLAAATGARTVTEEVDRVCRGCVIDSRQVEEGTIFVAFPGEKVDGNDFAPRAIESGAGAVVLTREPDDGLLSLAQEKGCAVLLTDDPEDFLLRLAHAYRTQLGCLVIGITGSIGKTTTKDMVASVLSQHYRVLKTEGNFNNELGLPLTLFRLTSQDQICVLEMGMNHFGEIDYLTQIARPDVAVITNIGDAHIENLGSRGGILRAKSEIFRYMQPGSLAVLNGDDPLLRTLEGTIGPDIVFFGEDLEPPYAATSVHQLGAKGLSCTIRTPRDTFDVTVPALGSHMIYPVLTACAIGERFGLTTEELIAGIRAFVPTKMRMNIVHQGALTILDDSYNANPQSMRAALEVLAHSGGTRRVAILGDMFELGALGPELHRSVGEFAGQVGGIDALLAIGDLAWNIYDAASQSDIPDVFYAPNKEEALALLPGLVQPGGVVLVKASRGMAFEELTRALQRLAPEE